MSSDPAPPDPAAPMPHQTASRIHALIACAGTGARAGFAQPKQYQLLAGKRVIDHTLDAFLQVPALERIAVVVSPEDDMLDVQALSHRVQRIPRGGATRDQTVRNGLQALLEGGCSPEDWVLVHDAARCLIRASQIIQLMQAVQEDAVGGLLAHRIPDTLIGAGGDARMMHSLDRAGKWSAQTPQMFRLGTLLAALQAAQAQGLAPTDEASAIARTGLAPKLVEGGAENFKLTHPEDFAMAEVLLQARALHEQATSMRPVFPHRDCRIRIGEGWDVHRLVDAGSTGRALIFGGVVIPHSKGLLGHSDADALCHAIMDALLGAAGLGDIGGLFPDTDPAYAGADSVALLAEVVKRLGALNWRIVNVDSTIIAQAPKLAPHIGAIRAHLARVLMLDPQVVNVKAKTAEGLGAVGRQEAIETRAVVMIART